MAPELVSLVQQSFKQVVPIADTAADLFYDRLFFIAPDVRALFPDDLAEQKKKLMKGLTDAMVESFGVKPEVVTVQIIESPKTDKAKGGVPFTER